MRRNIFLHIHAPRVHVFSLRPGYTLGLGLILSFLFVVLVFTGLVLMVYYTPAADRAYDSVKDIIYVVPGGRVVRNMHRWAGQGMVVFVFLHMLRVFYTASYGGGRSRNWIYGVCMLVLALFSNFSGYLLPWDQLAYWAVTIGANIAAAARELTDLLGITPRFDPGGFLKSLLLGGEQVGEETLTRFFMLHVILLPLAMLSLMALHFWRIRKDGGLSRPATFRSDRGTTNKWMAWPVLMWTELSLFLLVLAGLLGMGIFVDAPLLEMANPMHPENPAKSPWYFLGIQEMVSYSAFSGGLLIPVLYLAFLFSIPFVDREEESVGIWFSGRTGRRVIGFSLAGALVWTLILLAVHERMPVGSGWVSRIPSWVSLVFNPATLVAIAAVLWAGMIRRRTGSTRMAALALFTVALVALVAFTLVGIVFRGPNWEFYWTPAQWPRM
ncbi:MAG: cytochrome b N-terminal domain-containing protein [Bacteroidales bacterium]